MSRRRTKRIGALGASVMVLVGTLATATRLPVAEAVVANRLLNGSFENVYDPPSESHYEGDDWTETNLDGVASGQVDAHFVSNGSAGSVYVNDASVPSGGGTYSAVIYPDPDPDFVDHPPILTQEVPLAYLAGRNPTISGSWTRTSGSSIGIKVTLKYATSTIDGNGKEIGEWNDTNCTQSDTTNSGWESFSFSCSSSLPSEKIWEASLVVEPLTPFATNVGIRVDKLAVETDDAQTFTAGSWTDPDGLVDNFAAIPSSANVIGSSKRYSNDPASVDNGVVREVYAMKSDGTNATRITTTGHGYANTVVNPADHNFVASARFTLDWDDNDVHSVLVDPMRVYVFDLDQDKEIAITPTYWSAGLGGLEWTTDGRYLVFGVNPGRHWELWKADVENNFALSKVTSDTDACVESDVNVSNFSHWVTYRKAARHNGNCYPRTNLGQIEIIHLDAGSQTTVWTPDRNSVCTGTPPSCVSDDGLPYGAYDPNFMKDDLELVFSNSRPDDGDPDSYDTYDTYRIPVTGGTPTHIFGFPAIQDVEGDWTYVVSPYPHWNPAGTHATNPQGVAFELTHDDVDGMTYWGMATYDPYGDQDDYERRETYPSDDGLGFPKFITGGHHDPSAQAASPANGGFDTNPTNVYERDAAFAVANDALGESHTFSSFGLEDSVPANATIDGIRLHLGQAASSSIAWGPHVDVELSWDGGTNWTSAKASATWPVYTAPGDLAVGAANDTWGRTWSASEMDDLQVRLTFDCTTPLYCGLKDWSLDHLAIRVFWRT